VAIRDRALKALRRVFGDERDAREAAESPSGDALQHAPSSTYAIWGREDIGGLLSVSQNLMDRYADYEAMNDYPDIRCFTGEMKVYIYNEDTKVIEPKTILELAREGDGLQILAFDTKKKIITKVAAENPRISGRNAEVVRINLSNGEHLRVTPDHKILVVESQGAKPESYVEAKDLKKGDLLVGTRAGFSTAAKSLLTVNRTGGVRVEEDPLPDGRETVFDVTTSTHNLIVNGVVCHNSAFHYFANDATQPNMDNGRVVWVQSNDEAVVDMADTLIKRRLRLEDDLFSIAYTLAQYGNDFEEVLVNDNGVVGLNNLAAPTMRRVEKLNGSLIGYVQDVTGRFTANQDELRRMLAGSMEIPKHVALFEDWQVCHFRSRSTTRRSPYGVSVAEGARWIWKRLVMLEDAVMIYKLCLRGDSQIWTPEGRKAIADLKEGDEVYSYTTADKLKRTKVVYKKHNGQDTIYRVYSDHREFFANKTHPVLVETVVGQGSGRPRIRRLDYVEVQDLKPGVHRLVTPKKNANDWEEIRLRKPLLHSKARLVRHDEVTRSLSYPQIAKEVGVHHYRARYFFGGDYELKTDTAVALLESNGYDQPEDLLEIEEHWGGERGVPVKGVTPPETVTEDFARWWGFMLGDGFITTRQHKQRAGHTKAHTAQNEVGFALGADDKVNAYYKALFDQWAADVKLVGDTGHRFGAYTFVSSKFAEFMTLNGFIPGAHHKRLPEWIYRAHPKIKLAMIRGFADANAHIKPRSVSQVRRRVRHEVARFEVCNKALLEDLRELAMQLGLTVTFIRERERKGGRTIKGSKKPLPARTSYCMDISYKPQPMTEVLRGVEEIETDDIWDIGVEADEHNFITDGCVVHNTRSPARYAFYVDVTDVPANRVESFLKRAKRDLKKKKSVNPNNNFLDMRYNPLANDEDFFIAVRDGRALSRVEVLSGPDYQNTDDVEYFQRKLHGALMVPRAYLGQDAPIQGRAILSNEDVRAARVSLQLQKELKLGVEQLIRTDLAARRHPNPWAIPFDVMMTVPSNIYELAAMEVKNARADFAARTQPYMSMHWLLENVFKLSDDEIRQIEKQRRREASMADKMGMDPSFAPFTGGRPPEMDEQPPPEGQPPGEQPQGLEQVPPQGLEQVPPQGLEEVPPPKGAPMAAWRAYDRRQRLEERRHRESRRNHQQLVDMIGTLRENDANFARRLEETSAFLREFKEAALKKSNGRLMAVPSASTPTSPRR